MVRLVLRLLGSMEITLDGEPATGFQSSKVRALLAYLAVEADRSHRRETLAGLLWPDWPERSARTNLRNALSNLRSAIGDRDATPPFLRITRETIQFNTASDHLCDVTAFDDLAKVDPADEAANRQWEEAIALYRGSLLEGFSVADSPAFEEWALLVRERLQRQVLTVLQRLTDYYGQRGEYGRACEYARRQVELEPWQEEAHRTLMRLLTLSGQRSAALVQYDACCRLLKEELNVEPEEDTTRLYEQIRDGWLTPPREVTHVAERPAEVPTSPPPISPPAELPTAQAPVFPLGAAPLEGERRVITVLRANVCRSAELLEEADTEAWAEAMNRVFQILGDAVYRYGGEIDQLRGDDLMAFFGVPTAHEDDSERAVLAALAMQEEIKAHGAELAAQEGVELQLRVGVSTGEVVVASIGDSRWHRGDTAMGQAILLAESVESAAGPGTVLVGEDTYRLVRPLFEWELSGEIAVKGVREPVVVYRPLARKAITDKGRGIAGLESPLVGRQTEFYALQEAVGRVRTGVGGIVTLVGEAGIGKSRLVTEVRKGEPAESDTVWWVEGRCLSYGSSIAYLPWLDMLRELLGLAPDVPPATVREKLRHWVNALCPDCFDDVFPYLAHVMSLPLEEEVEAKLRGLGAEGLKVSTFRAVETLIVSAAQQPLVIVLEDLHWADPTSLELLERLLALTDHAALLIMCVFRPETEHGCWRIKETAGRLYRHRHSDLWLEPLSAAESEALVGNLLYLEDLPQDLRSRILGRAEGNPFFVEEILRSLIDGGAIKRDDATGRWHATRDVVEITIPDTLHGVLVARIDGLEREVRRVLELASVIGRVFFHRVLVDIAGDERHLDDHLVTLQREQLIRERARVPELAYIFKHELTREAAYNGLLKRERRTCHRQVAEALERLYSDRVEEQVGLLAQHWERAEEPEKAIPYLLRAGERGYTAYANAEAIDYYRRAQVLLDGSQLEESQKEWRLAALKGLGQIYLGIGELDEAEACLQEAVALGREMNLPPRELVRLYFWLGEVFYWQSRPEDKIRIGEEGLALLGDDLESVEAALMNQEAATGHSLKGNFGKQEEYTRRTARFVRRLPYSEVLRPAYEHIIELYLYSDRSADEAMRWTQALEEKASLHHDLRALGTVHRIAGEILEQTGDLSGAVSRFQQALDRYTRIGDTKHASYCLRFLGKALLDLGDLQEAERYARKGLEAAQTLGYKAEMAAYYGLIGMVSLCRGDFDAAVDAVQRALQVWQEMDARGGEAEVTFFLGWVYLARGERHEALRCFQEFLSLLQPEWLSQNPAPLYAALFGLEEAYQGSTAFHAFCSRFRDEHPEVKELPLVQWFLEPAQVETFDCPLLYHDGFSAPLSPDWIWVDPFDDCSFELQDGLVIHAVNGRELGGLNKSAPRMLRPAAGDMVIQAVCAPVSDLTFGGLLLWKNKENCLAFGPAMVSERRVAFGFSGRLANEYVPIGRGRLVFEESVNQETGESQSRVFLRLERAGDRVDAFCSIDGENWFTAGYTTFPAEDPVQVGLYAIGNIERIAFPGAYPDGTAIRFESFDLWEKTTTSKGD
jgi:predicted ATPase/DNA-binding SARP family transcriptional activator/class 3 adenylate cyclase